jgi:hypothetical protein
MYLPTCVGSRRAVDGVVQLLYIDIDVSSHLKLSLKLSLGPLATAAYYSWARLHCPLLAHKDRPDRWLHQPPAAAPTPGPACLHPSLYLYTTLACASPSRLTPGRSGGTLRATPHSHCRHWPLAPLRTTVLSWLQLLFLVRPGRGPPHLLVPLSREKRVQHASTVANTTPPSGSI